MARDIEIGGHIASRNKVKRLTARQMRFIEYGWRAIFQEVFFTFSTLMCSFIIGMIVFAQLNGGELETTNAPATVILTLFYAGTIIYVFGSAWLQLSVTHYYIPGKSLARFRLTEETIKKLFTIGGVLCIALFAILFVLSRLGFETAWAGRTLPAMAISFYFASKLIKLHGDTDQIASKYITDNLECKNSDIILSYQSFKYSPKKGSRVVGATNEVVFSANHNGADWVTTVIPFSEIMSFGMRAASRRSFSLDQPLYVPSAARVTIQTHAGIFYTLLLDTPDGFQTNCFLFCKGLLMIIDRYLGAKYYSMLNTKNLKRSVHTDQSPNIGTLPEGSGVFTHIGRAILISAPNNTEISVTTHPSNRLGNRAVLI